MVAGYLVLFAKAMLWLVQKKSPGWVVGDNIFQEQGNKLAQTSLSRYTHAQILIAGQRGQRVVYPEYPG